MSPVHFIPSVLMRFTAALLVLLLVKATALSATPLQLDAGSARDLEVRAADDGTTELRTTGADPHVHTMPLPAGTDLARDHRLSLEYFSLEGTDALQVFLLPPEREAVSVKVGGLSRSEGWTSYFIDLAPALAKTKQKVTALRLDFGTKANRTLKLRNLQVRPATAEERAFESRRAAQAMREVNLEKSLRAYLDAKFACAVTQVRATAEKIIVEGRVAAPGGELVLVEVPIYAEIGEPAGFPVLAPIRAGADGRFNCALDRLAKVGERTHDRLFSRYAVARKTADGGTLVSHARYVDTIEPKWNLPEEKPRSRKGLGGLSPGRPVSDIDELGIGAVTVNILPASFMRMTPGAGRTAFEVAGRTYFADDRAVAQLDQTMLAAAKRRVVVSAIILVSQAAQSPDKQYGRLVAHPDAHPAGHFAMPNVLSEEGHAAYSGALDFLARRYSQPDGAHGRIHHWIVHNEVDAGWEWTNAGEKTALRYLDLYHKSMRTVQLIARQYDAHAKAFISLTHYWTQRASPPFYPSRDLLKLLLDFSHAEGDFEWAIAYHPYPQSLRNPRTWEDQLAQFTFDTPQITFKNIEVLDAWVRLPRNCFHGKPRSVQFTEQGPNSPDYSEKSLREQAAALAYVWKKLQRLDTIEVFHFHNWVDNRGEGGLRIGLRRFPDDPGQPLGKKPVWFVFQALDTPQEDAATEFAKEVIGIKSWDEIRPPAAIK